MTCLLKVNLETQFKQEKPHSGRHDKKHSVFFWVIEVLNQYNIRQ